MTINIVPLTTIQKIPEISINLVSAVTPVTVYTCPTGKKARVSGIAVCSSTGAAGVVHLKVNGNIIHDWDNAGVAQQNWWKRTTQIENWCPVEFQLDAGQACTFDQDVGTNAVVRFLGKVQEVSV